jgi:hypothetical protein
MILRKNIQQSWEMRWASPSTPTSWHNVLNGFDGGSYIHVIGALFNLPLTLALSPVYGGEGKGE